MEQEREDTLNPQDRIQQLEQQAEQLLGQIAALQKTVVDWHSAMFGAIQLILRPYRQNLTLEREHLLNLMPTRLDCLVIKKNSSIPINLAAFRLLRRYNIIELKSYRDNLDENVLWHTIGYAATYKSQEEGVEADDLTITLIRSSFPRQLLRDLERKGWHIEQPSHNIFYLSGIVSIPIQIVVAQDLGEDYLPLEILTGRAKEADVRKFTEFRAQLSDPQERNYADAVLWACSEANVDLFRKLREDEKMYGALREIMKDDLLKERQEGKLEGILEGLREGKREGMREGKREGKREGMREGMRVGEVTALYKIVQDGEMLPERAAKRAGLEPSAFLSDMRKAGYAVPEARL